MYDVVLLVCCSWVALLCPSVQAYENLALHQLAWQSSTALSYTGADRAVDGLYTNLDWRAGDCAASVPFHTTAEWRVDLGRVLSIHEVSIKYSTDNQVWDKNNGYTSFFLGFSVYISNTTNKEDGVLCFRDTNYTRATIPNPVNITCPYHGRYVIYYNNRTHPPYPEGYSDYTNTDLCEVEVYGCPTPGRYGENCSLLCPENCNCDVIDNTCVQCVSGYRGHLCYEECDGHTYGVECKQSCGNCSGGVQCDHVTGSCPNGCDAGMYGDRCDLVNCTGHTYGLKCNQSCGKCSGGVQCDYVTGSCPNGCDAGMYGYKCDLECAGHTYGLKCNQSCGNCSGGVQCDHVTGRCPNGCDVGMYGDRCDFECAGHTYGLECSQSCGKCSGGVKCDHVTGRCPNGCDAGIYGDTCDLACGSYTYGVECKELCGNCSNGEPCHHVDGSCPYGCDVGVYGKTCDEACQSGRYGISCAKTCGQNCQGCNRLNGVCEFGCHPGWTGTFCEKRSKYVFRYFLSYKQFSAQNPCRFCIIAYPKYFIVNI
ncbi:uncharacterized protein LOC111109108 [Crassostrea virginica]